MFVDGVFRGKVYMNILVYRYNSICEDAVIRGLKELGHTVHEVTLEI